MQTLNIFSFAASSGIVYAGTGSGVWLSSVNGEFWLQMLGNEYVLSLAASGNNVFAGTYGNIWRSSDGGYTWQVASVSSNAVRSLALSESAPGKSGQLIFAGTDSYPGSCGVYFSSNNGTSWNQTSLSNQNVYSLAVSGMNIFAGTEGSGVYLSADNGANWTQTSLNNQFVRALAVSGTNIFAGTDGNGVFLSSNNGTEWKQTSLNNQYVYSLAVSGNNIFAGTFNSGVYISIDNGAAWIQKNEGLNPQSTINTLLKAGDYVLAGKQYYGIWRRLYNEILPVKLASFSYSLKGRNVCLNWVTDSETNNSGFEVERYSSEAWKNIGFLKGQGTKNTPTYYFYEDRNVQSGFCKYRLKQIDYNGNYEYHNLNSVVEIGIPSKFALSQNYPNPFNPSTKIDFTLPSDSKVSLIIYDARGREVRRLINNEHIKAGYYTETFSTSGLSGGIYFCRLKAGIFTQTKKMLFLK